MKHRKHKKTKKVTHRKFPKGHYLLVHVPYHVNSIREDSTSNEMENSILTSDMSNKFKRNALPDDEYLEYDVCCHPRKCSAPRCT